MNIPGADSIVEEYLIHRGFTKTFRCLQKEIAEDRTKGFNATRIVEQIFFYIYAFEIESFVNLWDFLSKRFFMHLDQEHVMLLSNVKSDLIKFYLVNAIKKSRKEKVAEFFTKYSHEIITESGDNPNGLRNWYVLPYMEDPEKDPDFSVYFTTRWADILRVTLSNFLSSILLNAPPPKLLLLERWFRSESQQEMRLQMKHASENVDKLLTKQKQYEDRISTMRSALRDLVAHVHHHQALSRGEFAGGERTRNVTAVGLFETDEEADKKRELAKELGGEVLRLATQWVQQGSSSEGVGGTTHLYSSAAHDRQHRQRSRTTSGGHHISVSGSSNAGAGPEDTEIQLMVQLQQWLKVLRSSNPS